VQEALSYSLVDSPLGRLLLAATNRGLRWVSLGDEEESLVAELRAAFPGAELQRDDAVLSEAASALVEHLSDGQPLPDLPLDAPASAFQWRVWEALRAIPYGQTRSYGQLAALLGQPAAVRAVAAACAANPLAVVIPCHRAVGSDGALTGYRWGLARKMALLQAEAGLLPLGL
jgi:AraC family transcriptional regulator of adaptative response/methylated-DNA-[protein]-cysteine methyltransferase